MVNRKKLMEVLELINEMTADVNGEYPIGLIRVRKLLLDVIADRPDDGETMELTAEPPRRTAAKPASQGKPERAECCRFCGHPAEMFTAR